jgi:predicted Zn-dependent protease
VDDFSTDIPEPRPLYQRLLIGGLIAVFLVAAACSVPWVYGKAKLWRARHLVYQAQDLFAAQKRSDGVGKLMAAFALEPRDPVVVRALADDQLAAHDPNAVAAYRLLTELPNATRDDRRDAARGLLAYGDAKTARAMVQVLMGSSPGAEDYALQAQVQWQARQTADALASARQAVEMAPGDRSDQLLLAQMLALSNDPALQSDAKGRLLDLAAGADLESLKALELLARFPGLDPVTARQTLEQLRAHPLLDDEGRFAAWELERRLADRPPAEILQEAADFFRNAEVERRAVAGRWLNEQGAPELVVGLSTPKEALGSRALFLVRVDALASVKDWAEVQKEMLDPHVPLAPALVYLFRARAAQELGDAGESEVDWNRAREAASGDPNLLSYLGHYAAKLGLYDEAKATYIAMIGHADEALDGYTALLQLEAGHDPDTTTLETLRQMTIDLPNLPEAKNDWAYLSLLLNANIDDAKATAQTLVADHPEMLAYRSTLALGYLKEKDPADAVKVYDGLAVDWDHTPASWRMIYAVALNAAGRNAQAAGIAAKIDRSQLRPPELALFRYYFPDRK